MVKSWQELMSRSLHRNVSKNHCFGGKGYKDMGQGHSLTFYFPHYSMINFLSAKYPASPGKKIK